MCILFVCVKEKKREREPMASQEEEGGGGGVCGEIEFEWLRGVG